MAKDHARERTLEGRAGVTVPAAEPGAGVGRVAELAVAASAVAASAVAASTLAGPVRSPPGGVVGGSADSARDSDRRAAQ